MAGKERKVNGNKSGHLYVHKRIGDGEVRFLG